MINADKNSAGSGAYVLDAMDGLERDDFEAQIAESQELRNEVTELTDTAVLLGMAAKPVAPSAALRASIMDKIATTPQLPREVPEVVTLQPVIAEPSDRLQASGRSDTSSRLHTKTQARWFSRPVGILVSAAAAVLLVGGAVIGTTAVIGTQAPNTSQADALAAINAAPDVQHQTTLVASGGTATLVYSLNLKKAAFIASALPKLSSDKTYELWYINSAGSAKKAGLFESTGKSTWQVLSGSMAKGDTVGVTVEPAGGTDAPTTKPVIAIPSA
jgi:anti-sigma-K factor RskA